MKPYYEDPAVTLYLGDCARVLAELRDTGFRADLAVVDPPYGDTHHVWDTWPISWPTWVSEVTDSMWCFGSARMFDTDRYRDDLRARWRMSHDVIWEKISGSGNPGADRFTRVHEHIRHYYRKGVKWRDVYHQPRMVPSVMGRRETIRRASVAPGVRARQAAHTAVLDGLAYARSVQRHSNMRRKGIHPAQKPVPLLEELIAYGAPEGGVVLDPMAGSGAVGKACQVRGRRAVLIEADEATAEKAARWLAEEPLEVRLSEPVRRREAVPHGELF